MKTIFPPLQKRLPNSCSFILSATIVAFGAFGLFAALAIAQSDPETQGEAKMIETQSPQSAFPSMPKRTQGGPSSTSASMAQALQDEMKTIRQRNQDRRALIQSSIKTWEHQSLLKRSTDSSKSLQHQILQDYALRITHDLFADSLTDETRYEDIQNKLAKQIQAK